MSPEARLAIMQAKAAGGEHEAAGVAQAFREAVRKAEQDRLSLETIKVRGAYVGVCAPASGIAHPCICRICSTWPGLGELGV